MLQSDLLYKNSFQIGKGQLHEGGGAETRREKYIKYQNNKIKWKPFLWY